jgi:polyisoprenoid-binding protein YceI
MRRSILATSAFAFLVAAGSPLLAAADPIAFKLLPNPSRASFKSDAPLETFVGTAAGGGLAGTLVVDPAKPAAASGQVKVDLNTVSTGIAKRDADMRAKEFLDTEGGEANRWAIFDIKSVDIAGPLQPGKETPAKVRGTLTIRGKPVDTVADARVVYVKLTPEQLEGGQKRFGFTSDNLKVKANLETTFTNHGMQVPQLFFLKVNNTIQLETDLTFVRQ